MSNYTIVNLKDIVSELKEDGAKKILSSFSSFANPDIEDFIKNKSIDFANKSVANTHIVFAKEMSRWKIAGYFVLANKAFFIQKEAIPSKTWEKRIERFGAYYEKLEGYIFPVPLIAQLGKNFEQGCQHLITGDELLKLATDMIASAQQDLSGKMIYLECIDHPKLTKFYTRNGFKRMCNRYVDNEEKKLIEQDYLVQFIKYT